MRQQSAPDARRAAPEAGFSLLEVLIGTVVLSVALLGHMASTFTEYRLARTDEVRSEVQQVARQLVGRMRSDDDGSGLYARLRALEVAAGTPGPATERLEDGRRCWPPTAYYPDFILPSWLESLHVLVEVPFDPDVPTDLREDLHQPRFGLPFDLDGDGQVEDVPCNDTYRALPVVLIFRWRPTGEAAHQLRVSTWLRTGGV